MDYSIPGFPVHHQLLELAQTHVHQVSDAIQPSHPLSTASPPVFNLSQHQGLFQWLSSLHQVAKVLEFQALVSVLPMKIQDWYPLGWTVRISLESKGLSRVFSNTTVQSINSSVLNFLYSPTLTSIHDYWKNHSLDSMDLCWQSNVSAFYYAVLVGHSFSSKEQASFNFMTAVTICSDFGAQKNKVIHCFHCFPIYLS